MMRPARPRANGTSGIPFPKRRAIFRLFTIIASLFLGTEAGFAQAPPFSWIRTAGGGGDDFGFGVAVDAVTNIYVAGVFSGNASFGSFNLTAGASGADIFLVKLSATGNPSWARQTGAIIASTLTSFDPLRYGKMVATDGTGNVYLIGNFQGTA